MARPGDTAEILRRLKQVHPDSVGRWGRMSAHQMICHLADACRMATGAKPVRHIGRLPQRTIVKWIALYVPLRWPPGIATTTEIDQASGGTKPEDFAADIAQLEAALELISRPATTFHAPGHPIFGRMSRAAWLRWAYLHADHHLRQFGA